MDGCHHWPDVVIVSQIIDEVLDFSVGGSSGASDATLRGLVFRYVNRASLEIFNATCKINDKVIRAHTFTTGETAEVDAIPNTQIFNVIDNDTQEAYFQKSYADIEFVKSLSKKTIQHSFVYNIDIGRMQFFHYENEVNQAIGKTFHISYVNFQGFVDETTDIDTFIYPSYYYLLVDGALHFLFLEEEGFRNNLRDLDPSQRFRKGLQDYITFLQKDRTYLYEVHTFCNV